MPSIRPRTTSRLIENFSRNSSSNPPASAYIAGFTLIGILLLGLVTWITVRYFRKRASAKREREVLASLPVRGLVKVRPPEKDLPEPPKTPPSPVEEDNFPPEKTSSPGPVLPELTFNLPTIPSAEDIIDFHKKSGTMPRPFSFAINAASSSSRPSSLLIPNASKRVSVVSTCSTISSILSSTGQLRKVRQVFTPVLPDELLLTHVGEYLTVLQTFDDGWCVVGRDNPAFKAVSGPTSLFPTISESSPESDAEVGAVPAWCFVKPAKGVRAERPVRSSSLGITIQIDAASPRASVISWSNF